MSTLLEIEQAVEALPVAEQEALFRFLAARSLEPSRHTEFPTARVHSPAAYFPVLTLTNLARCLFTRRWHARLDWIDFLSRRCTNMTPL